MSSRDRIQHVQSVADVSAIVVQDGLTLAPIEHGKFTFSTTGLTVKGVPTYDEWEEVGHMLAVMVRGLQFAVGDWILMGEQGHFGELAAQAIDAREWSDSTVRVYRSIASRVPVENRFIDQGLTFAHHMAVAPLPLTQQRVWLKRALGNGDGDHWPVNRLTQAIRAKEDDYVEPNYFWITANCATAKERDRVLKLLEREGVPCRSGEKRK